MWILVRHLHFFALKRGYKLHRPRRLLHRRGLSTSALDILWTGSQRQDFGYDPDCGSDHFA